jgi:hypothetical protein
VSFLGEYSQKQQMLLAWWAKESWGNKERQSKETSIIISRCKLGTIGKTVSGCQNKAFLGENIGVLSSCMNLERESTSVVVDSPLSSVNS